MDKGFPASHLARPGEVFRPAAYVQLWRGLTTPDITAGPWRFRTYAKAHWTEPEAPASQNAGQNGIFAPDDDIVLAERGPPGGGPDGTAKVCANPAAVSAARRLPIPLQPASAAPSRPLRPLSKVGPRLEAAGHGELTRNGCLVRFARTPEFRVLHALVLEQRRRGEPVLAASQGSPPQPSQRRARKDKSPMTLAWLCTCRDTCGSSLYVMAAGTRPVAGGR
jgi:hypothetical protein